MFSSDRRSDITDREVIELYNKGLNYRQIAKYFKTDSKIIIRRLFRNGVEIVKLSSFSRQDLNNNTIVKLYGEGKSTDEISHILKTNNVTIGNRLKSMGIKLRVFYRNDIKTDDLIRLYLDDKLSTVKIAKLYNTTAQLVKTRLKNAGVKRRTRLEAGDLIARKNICVICGIIFRSRSYWKGTGSTKRKTCSDKYRSILLKNLNIGSNNHGWKGGHSQGRYQRIRCETKPQICEVCRTIDDLDTHHIDRNKSNNIPENIRVLCGSHHAMLHYVEDERGLVGELSKEEKQKLQMEKLS